VYGNALLAMNWSPVTHHGLIVRKADTTRWWEDYLKTEFTLDADAGALTITGQVEKCPLTYERRYTFGGDALTVELKLAATARFECASLVENVPLVFGSVKARGVTVVAPKRGRAFRVQDSTGAGVEWAFDMEQSFVKYETGLRGQKWTDHVCGRVEVALPRKIEEGQSVELRYQMRPVGAAR